MGGVFISHNWRDKPLARRFAENLKYFEIEVWMDEREIKYGDPLIKKIRQGLDEAEFVLALISKHSIDSEWVIKELDLAMNQEIEGRRVKVIPVKCDAETTMPGFLQGKLHMDAFSDSAFQESFPRLLVTLGVSEAMRLNLQEKGYEQVAQDAKQSSEILKVLIGDDTNESFRLMKSYCDYSRKDILGGNSTAMDCLVRIAKESKIPKLRYAALQFLAYCGDHHEYIDDLEILLSDENPRVVAYTIDVLKSLRSQESITFLIDRIEYESHPLILKSLYGFFEKVRIEDQLDLLEVISTLLNKSKESAAFGEFRLLNILFTQWNGDDDDVLVEILPFFKSENFRIRLSLLRQLYFEAGEEKLFIDRVDLKQKLQDSLIEILEGKKLSDQEVVYACAIGFFWYDFNDRGLLWKTVSKFNPTYQKGFLHALDGFRIKHVFDKRVDFDAITRIISDLKSLNVDSLRIQWLDILVESESILGLNTILELKEFWSSNLDSRKLSRALTKLDADSLNSRVIELLKFLEKQAATDHVVKVFLLLAKRKMGVISLSDLIEAFPEHLSSTYHGWYKAKEIVVSFLLDKSLEVSDRDSLESLHYKIDLAYNA